KGNRVLLWIPQAFQGGLLCELVTRLGVPEQGEIIDKEDQRSSACSRLGHAVLRIFETEKLLDVAEANLQGPTSREYLQDLRGAESEIEGEEAIVAAAAAGVMHHDDAQELLAGAGIPQGIDGLVPELDLLSVKGEGGLDPFGIFVLRHLKRVGGGVALILDKSSRI